MAKIEKENKEKMYNFLLDLFNNEYNSKKYYLEKSDDKYYSHIILRKKDNYEDNYEDYYEDYHSIQNSNEINTLDKMLNNSVDGSVNSLENSLLNSLQNSYWNEEYLEKYLKKQINNGRDKDLKIHVLLHPVTDKRLMKNKSNQSLTIDDYITFYDGLTKYDEGFIINIFYKDGKNYMVRLAQRGEIKRRNRSLKKYSHDEINEMIHLRGIEKQVFNSENLPFLVYYQPNTKKLNESIILYQMKDVILDYSHIDENHRANGFVNEEEISRDYKIAKKLRTIKKDDPVVFVNAVSKKHLLFKEHGNKTLSLVSYFSDSS